MIMLSLYLFLICLVLLFILPISIIFAPNKASPLANPHKIHRRLMAFCGLMFLLFFAVGTRINTPTDFTEANLRVLCETAAYNHCTDIVSALNQELWLTSLVYPVGENQCFTGHAFACMQAQYALYGTELSVNHSSMYVGMMVLFALPWLIVYYWLRLLYVQPDPRKRKAKE